jgi:branched-chain amino acid transport system substrate-binding protein
MFRRKNILVTLSLLMTMTLSVFFFTACGKGTTDPVDEVKQDKKFIKIGAILPLSGNAAVVGDYSKKALELAAKEINDDGGVNGRKIELLIEDSKGQPNIGVNIIKKLNSGGDVPDLIYCQLSSVCLSIKPITESKRQILFAVSGASELLKGSSYTFRNYVSPERVALSAMEIIKKSLKAESLGIFYSNNDFGLSINNAIEKKLDALNIKLDFSESFDEKLIDYRDIIQKQLENNPKNIYIVGIGRSLGILIKQIRESGFKGNIIGGLETPFPDVLKIAGEAADGIYYINFAFDNKSKEATNRKFIESYYEMFNQLPQTPSAVAYDAIYLYKNGAEILASWSAENVRDNLLKIENAEGCFGKVSIKQFEIIYPLQLKKIKIGEK